MSLAAAATTGLDLTDPDFVADPYPVLAGLRALGPLVRHEPTGLLLASSLEGPYRADYINDLATSAGSVELRERIVTAAEVGSSLREIRTGQAVRLIRDGKMHALTGQQRLAPGDRILEIVDSI